MNQYISLLRGINVSGKNKIKMAELKEMFFSLGFENVITYIQSGNVIFSSQEKNKKDIEKKIKEEILKQWNFDVPVLIKTVEEFKNVVENNPFIEKDENIDITKLHLTFLKEIPLEEHLEKIKTYSFSPDEFIIDDKNVFVHCPNGYGRTKIHNNFFERKLKVEATTRNWKSILKLIELSK